jgi:hypothetical protein
MQSSLFVLPRVTGMTVVYHRGQAFIELFCWAGLKPDPLISASQVARITGMNHHRQPFLLGYIPLIIKPFYFYDVNVTTFLKSTKSVTFDVTQYLFALKQTTGRGKGRVLGEV